MAAFAGYQAEELILDSQVVTACNSRITQNSRRGPHIAMLATVAQVGDLRFRNQLSHLLVRTSRCGIDGQKRLEIDQTGSVAHLRKLPSSVLHSPGSARLLFVPCLGFADYMPTLSQLGRKALEFAECCLLGQNPRSGVSPRH